MSNLNKILLNKINCKSIWFMRQAGRYLPEFQKIRSKNQNFIKLCLNSKLSSEITLQPIKRFNLDSAIIFSDILMVPYALGQDVIFTKNFGPKLSDFDLSKFLKNEKNDFSNKLSPIYKAVDITRKKLKKSKSLISFIGAPWTLIVYMLNAKEDKKEINLRLSYAIDEMKHYNEYKYVLINEKVHKTVNEVKKIIEYHQLIMNQRKILNSKLKKIINRN